MLFPGLSYTRDRPRRDDQSPVNGRESDVYVQSPVVREAAYDAKNVKYEKRSNATSLSMDIASAYPKAAEVKSWKRTVALDKSKEIVTVTDNFTLEQANTLAQTFMTVCSTDISVPGKIIFLLPGDRKLYLEYDKSFWTVGKERMLLTTPEDQGLKHSWDGQDIWRILLTAKSRPMNHSVRYTIHL